MKKVSSFQFPVSSFQFPVKSSPLGFFARRVSLLFLLFIPFLFVSCEKENTTELNMNSEILSENRSEQGINYVWLEEFRLNLLSTENQFSYSISEVEYGIETIYNLLGSVGPMDYSNPRIYRDSILLPISDDSINGASIKNLSSKVFSLVEDYVFKSDKGFLFVNLDIEQSGSNAKALISVTAADVSEPDLTSPFAIPCEQNYFSPNDCYRSAFGNPRRNGIWGLGGPCGNPNDETSAQYEVEKAFIQGIPRAIFSNSSHPSIPTIKYIYSYTNPNPDFIAFGLELPIYSNPYADCQDLGSSFVDNKDILEDIEYHEDRLNCALCLVYDYINATKPQNKELCDIIVEGNFVMGAQYIHWTAEIIYCDVEIIPASLTWNEPQIPTMDPPSEDDFLMQVSFSDF